MAQECSGNEMPREYFDFSSPESKMLKTAVNPGLPLLSLYNTVSFYSDISSFYKSGARGSKCESLPWVKEPISRREGFKARLNKYRPMFLTLHHLTTLSSSSQRPVSEGFHSTY